MKDTKAELLRALATYMFLCPSHIVKLGIMSNVANARQLANQLETGATKDKEGKKIIKPGYKPFVGIKRPKSLNGHGSHESVVYLRKNGIRFCEQELDIPFEQIKFPRSVQKEKGKLEHMRMLIFCEIALRQTGLRVLFCDRDIDFVGGMRLTDKLERKTKIPILSGEYIDADAIFLIEAAENKYLYSLELERGEDTLKVLAKIPRYIEALIIGSIAEKYGLQMGCRILWILEEKSLLEAVLKRIHTVPDIQSFKKFFLFKSYDEIDNFIHNWRNTDGELVTLF